MTEKHSYEIIVLDLDGTLTNRDKVITPKTKQRLMELQERGKKIVLASGRPTPGVLPLARELELAKYGSYILSFNGGRITNCKTGEIIFSRSLPQEANQKIIRLAEEEQVGLLSYDEAGAKLLTNQSDSPYAKLEARINGMELVHGSCDHVSGTEIPDDGGWRLPGDGRAARQGGDGEEFQRLPFGAVFPGGASEGHR